MHDRIQAASDLEAFDFLFGPDLVEGYRGSCDG